MAGKADIVVGSPEKYSPEFCEAIRAAHEAQMESIREDVKSIHDKFWSLTILILVQLCALLGALGYFILDHVDLVTQVEAYSNMLQ